MPFRKRTFRSLSSAAGDLWELVRKPRSLAGVLTGSNEVSPELREKLMLAVTSVNRCRYCTFVHTRLALHEGMTRDEVDQLLGGDPDGADESERTLMLYAQHWADTAGHPDLSARRALVAAQGEARAEAVEATLRAILFGNYFGNAVDGVLDTISGGRLGSRE